MTGYRDLDYLNQPMTLGNKNYNQGNSICSGFKQYLSNSPIRYSTGTNIYYSNSTLNKIKSKIEKSISQASSKQINSIHDYSVELFKIIEYIDNISKDPYYKDPLE